MATVVRAPFYVPRPPEDAVWQPAPRGSRPLSILLTAVKMYGAGGQAPTRRQRFDYDSSESFWQFEPRYNLALVSSLQFPVSRGGTWNSPDDPPPWRPSLSRNLNLLTATAAATPFVNPAWKFGYVEDPGWQGQPDSSPVLQLLTAVKIYGAGGQVPTRRQRFDYDNGESFWQGRPTPSALLAPLLTVGGQVTARRWAFGYDDPAAWQPGPGRNINLLTAAAPLVPFVGQPWRFGGAEETAWQGRPSRNLNLLTAVAVVMPFAGALWRFGGLDEAPWRPAQGRNLLALRPAPSSSSPYLSAPYTSLLLLLTAPAPQVALVPTPRRYLAALYTSLLLLFTAPAPPVPLTSNPEFVVGYSKVPRRRLP